MTKTRGRRVLIAKRLRFRTRRRHSHAIPPEFVSAEVGTLDATTLVVTFDRDVSATDYSTGVTIKVNGSAASISAAERQTDHAVVYYTIPTVQAGDTVTWEYSAAAGHIVAESGGAALEDVTAQAVTNNVVPSGVTLPSVSSATYLAALLADTLQAGTVSAWNDQASTHHFSLGAESGSPVMSISDGIPSVHFEYGKWMQSSNFADNLSDFAIFVVLQAISDTTPPSDTAAFPILCKINNEGDGAGWILEGSGGVNFFFQDAGGNNLNTVHANPFVLPAILTGERLSGSVSIYVNNAVEQSKSTTFTDFSNTEPVRINATGDLSEQFTDFEVSVIFIMQINDAVNWPTDRAAIVAWLAQYGVTL